MEELDVFLINIRLCILFIISISLYFMAYTIARKSKVHKIRKSYDELISPILAEVLVDGKIDLKNLIMTTIVELQIKGNIEVMSDNCIRFVHKDNLEVHEYLLIDAIFGNKNIINIDEINKKFTSSKYYISDIIGNLSKICIEIQSQLSRLKLFSKKKSIILNVITYIAMLILINLPSILLDAKITNQYFVFILITGCCSVVASWHYLKRFTGGSLNINNNYFDLKINRINFGKIILATLILFLSLIVFFLMGNNLFYAIEMLIIYFINFITLNLAKNNVLSIEGLREREKILEFKNYLDEYNLTKRDGLENYIEWDKNLAYSVAFGIPNPVTEEIYKKWNNLNLTLNFTNNLI